MNLLFSIIREYFIVTGHEEPTEIDVFNLYSNFFIDAVYDDEDVCPTTKL